MDRLISILLSITLTCLIAIYSGCSGGAATDNLDDIIPTTPSPSPTPGPSPSPSPSPTPSIDTLTSLKIGTGAAVSDASYVHLSTSFSTACEVSASATSSQDISCYIEMPEADVVFRDLPITYQMPADMCRYLERSTYWFYNEEVGEGPLSLTIHRTKTVSETGVDTFAESYAFDCTVNGVLDTGCDDQTELVTAFSSTAGTASFKCIYDRSDEPRKHNCCFGSYTYRTIETTDTITSATTTSTTVNSAVETRAWGGAGGSCIGGPGRTDWTAYDVDGFPISVIANSEAGLAETYTVRNPNSVQELIASIPRSIHTSNFYSTAGSTDHTHAGFVASATTSVQPYFFDPIDDRNGSIIPEAGSAYEFLCLDNAYEVRHRIRVYVREFDTRADYEMYLSTSGTSLTPDRPGQFAPANCVGLSGKCDDYNDIDDFLGLELNLAAYDTSDVTTRDANFPYIIYK